MLGLFAVYMYVCFAIIIGYTHTYTAHRSYASIYNVLIYTL